MQEEIQAQINIIREQVQKLYDKQEAAADKALTGLAATGFSGFKVVGVAVVVSALSFAAGMFFG